MLTADRSREPVNRSLLKKKNQILKRLTTILNRDRQFKKNTCRPSALTVNRQFKKPSTVNINSEPHFNGYGQFLKNRRPSI